MSEKIQKILKKYKENSQKNESEKECIIKTIKEIVNISLGLGDVEIKNGQIVISTTSIKNKEIKIKKEAILTEVRKQYKYLIDIK